jgi:hypothetical protein
MQRLDKVDRLQVEQDLQFQHLEWRIEQIGKILVGLFLIAALCGVFGSGYLSRARAASPSASLIVDYDRFTRREGPSDVVVEASGQPHSELGIWFSETLVRQIKVEQITPEQVSTESSPSRTKYIFRTGIDGKTRVRFHVQPKNAGKMNCHIGVDGGEDVTFWSFVYP